MKYNQLNIKKFNLDVIDYGILSVDNKPNRKNNLAGTWVPCDSCE